MLTPQGRVVHTWQSSPNGSWPGSVEDLFGGGQYTGFDVVKLTDGRLGVVAFDTHSGRSPTPCRSRLRAEDTAPSKQLLNLLGQYDLASLLPATDAAVGQHRVVQGRP